MKILALVLLLLCGPAVAAVDQPINTMPQAWTGVVVDVQLNPLQACIAGWERNPDKYGDWLIRQAFVDCTRLSNDQCLAVVQAASDGDLIALMSLRTVDVANDPAMLPCRNKLQAPPPAWIVAPTTSGKRPAYLLNADGTRGAQSGTADTMIGSQPMWCDGRTRAVTTTNTVYMTWATAAQTADPAEPKRVTLCREMK